MRALSIAFFVCILMLASCGSIHEQGDVFDESHVKVWVEGKDPKYILVFEDYSTGSKYYKNTRKYDADEVEGILVRGKRVVFVYKKGEFYPVVESKKREYENREREQLRIQQENRRRLMEEEKLDQERARRNEQEKRIRLEQEIRERKKIKDNREQVFKI